MKPRPFFLILLAALSLGAALPAGAERRPPFPVPPFLLPPLPDVRHLVPIPRTPLYFVPDVDVDIVFYDGYWWTLRDGGWYRSRDYRREFIPVPPRYVPRPLLKLRPDFRHHYRDRHRVPYGEWRRKHWRPEWDRERHDKWEHRGDGDHRDRGRHGRD